MGSMIATGLENRKIRPEEGRQAKTPRIMPEKLHALP
jgi:hypothetical protein